MRKLLNILICILMASPLAAFDTGLPIEGLQFGFLQISLDGNSFTGGTEELSETVLLNEGDVMQVLQATYGDSRFYNSGGTAYVYPTLYITSDGVVTERRNPESGYVAGPASIQVGYKFDNNRPTWTAHSSVDELFCRVEYAILRAGASTQSSYVTIPANSSGNFEVKLQTSSDLETWSPTTPGIFPYGDNAKFFRLVVE